MGPLGVPFVHCHSQLCLTWREFLRFSERKRKAATKRGDEGLISHIVGDPQCIKSSLLAQTTLGKTRAEQSRRVMARTGGNPVPGPHCAGGVLNTLPASSTQSSLSVAPEDAATPG